MDNLKLRELRIELDRRGLFTAGMKKPQLEREFEELKRGISNVPALLQGVAGTLLQDFYLDHYEISPMEPLYDIK